MKGVQIVEPNKLQIVDLEKPQIDKENNVLVRMVAAGICGSDVGIYHGTNAAATYPRIIGHENVGIVEEIGEGVTRVKVGDRVIIDQVTACGHCYACRKGRPNVCGNLKVRGVHIDGGYREYMAVPDRDCYLVPEILSDEEAVMIEPTTIAVQCCSRAQLESEDTVMIIGSGALGSSILRIVKLYNPKAIIVTDIDDAKLEEAKKNGATYTINSLKEDVPAKAHELTEGYGPTVTIDAACVKGSLLTALQATGNAGRVITMGFSVAPTEVNQFVITSKELDVRGSRLQNRKFQDVIDLVNEGKQIVNDNDARYAAFAKAEALFLEEDLTCPTVYDVSWCLTHANEYSKINAMYGGCNYKAVNWETSEEAYTTVQYEQFAKAFDQASQG